MELNKKLNLIQIEVDKIQKNANGHGFKYADGNAVLDKIRPLMVSSSLLCVPYMENPTIEQIFYKNLKGQEKREFLFCASGGYKWIDSETGDMLDIPWVFCGNNDDASQSQGNALTYNERYFLLKFFKIQTPTDDPDSKGKKKETPNYTNKITPDDLINIAKEKNISETEILAKYKKETGKDVSEIKFISQDKKQEYYQLLKEK